MNRTSFLTRAAVISAVGGALCVAAAGPSGASTVGLIKASQLPSGFTKEAGPITISGSTILKGTKSLGGGLGGATSGCKGAPGATNLKSYTAHIVAFSKTSGTGATILSEIVLETPSAASATKYFNLVKASSAKCSGTQTVTMSGVSVKVSFKIHNTTIAKAGADEAVGTVVSLTGKTSVMGINATLGGGIAAQTYRKGADIVEVIAEGLSEKESGNSVAVTLSSGSAALDAQAGKAAVADL